MTAPVRFPRFFVTSPAPCPYLAGKTERKLAFHRVKEQRLIAIHASSPKDSLSRKRWDEYLRLDARDRHVGGG